MNEGASQGKQIWLERAILPLSRGIDSLGLAVQLSLSHARPSSKAETHGQEELPHRDGGLIQLTERLLAFVAEREPFALQHVEDWIAEGGMDSAGDSPGTLRRFARGLGRQVKEFLPDSADAGNLPASPTVKVTARLRQAREKLTREMHGFFEREAILASLSAEERLELLQGMVWTRAIDNQLKAFFLGGEVRYGSAAFQGKGFRSLGQEAIYGVALRLRRGAEWKGDDGSWNGDLVAPLIRDLGAALGMKRDAEAVRRVLSAQMGKAGPPMFGKDFHIGELDWGVLPASAPLSISTLTASGVAMGYHLAQTPQIAVAFIGEGGSSLGEWHEAINLAAARSLPIVFCIENNQTALSTPVPDQTCVRTFADKAQGYGVDGVTIDGTDAEMIAATFSWAAERAREGKGPTLIETISMRMCGHAHHDDMLYLGKEPPIDWDYTAPTKQGYADAKAFAFWAKRDPIRRLAKSLLARGELAKDGLAQLKAEAEACVKAAAREVIDAPWPEPEEAGSGVCADEPLRVYREPLADRIAQLKSVDRTLPTLDPGPPFHPKGQTFLDAVMRGVGDALQRDERTFVYGQDVGGKYGNAFLLLRPLLEQYGDRILNSTLAEGGILGACIGAALVGRRPIGEIQFNDFVATGFNQLVNNAAKIRYRWGGSVPMVVRMPWGGLRKAGPYHSQNTEAWFYRTPGLKIVAPSTPYDARALFRAAMEDEDPVLFYEHIALYREPKIKQKLTKALPAAIPLGQAALRRAGSDLALISYGAFVHTASRIANALAKDGVECSVLDLRTLAPLDEESILRVARHCSKVMVIHEDTKTGGVGESLAARIQELAFEDLDAPVRVIGALDTPPPYSPPLEETFLPSDAQILQAARLLHAY